MTHRAGVVLAVLACLAALLAAACDRDRAGGEQTAPFAPVHYVPTAEGFAAAVRAGLGWGMYPEQLVGSFARIADVHLDVPLYWHCWKLDSPIVQAVTDVVRSAAAEELRRGRR